MVDISYLSKLKLLHSRTLVISDVPLKGSTGWPDTLTLYQIKVNFSLISSGAILRLQDLTLLRP